VIILYEEFKVTHYSWNIFSPHICKPSNIATLYESQLPVTIQYNI